MSCNVTIFNTKWITISGDSRGALRKDDQVYVATDECKKVHKIGNRVYYFSGIYLFVEYLFKVLYQAPSISIENISDICKQLERHYISEHEKLNMQLHKAGTNNNILVEIIIACVENGKPTIYMLESTKNYKPIKEVGNFNNAFVSSGWGSEEGAGLADKRLKLLKKPNDNDLFELYKDIYRNANCIYVGGTMTMYKLNCDGSIKEFNYKIPDKIDYPYLPDDGNIHCDPNAGIKVSKNTSNDPNNPVFTETFFIDPNGNLIHEGVFKSGATGARIEIDDNGLKSYNDDNQLNGIVQDKSSDNQFADLKIYFKGKEYFTIYNDVGAVCQKVYGKSFLTSRGESTTAEGTWQYNGSEIVNKNDLESLKQVVFDNLLTGFSGSFVSGDGKTVTVKNGLITNIV